MAKKETKTGKELVTETLIALKFTERHSSFSVIS
jgi:hypothetical protein